MVSRPACGALLFDQRKRPASGAASTTALVPLNGFGRTVYRPPDDREVADDRRTGCCAGAGVHGIPRLLPPLLPDRPHVQALPDLRPRADLGPAAQERRADRPERRRRRPHAPGVPRRPPLGPAEDAGRGAAPRRPRAPAGPGPEAL